MVERNGLSNASSALHKPFKTIEELIAILNHRGMKTDDRTSFVLEREGYYPVINGYKDLFLDKEASNKAGDDVFVEGTTFDDIYCLFTFDRELRSILMRYFAMAEAALKATSSYIFTEAHQQEKNPYLNVGNYRQKCRDNGKAAVLINEFSKAIGLDSKNELWRSKMYLSHYVDDYGGEVPLWVLMNYATLGQAFRFFCFMDEGLQNRIAKVFSRLYQESYGRQKRIHPQSLRIAFDHIKDYRNICAHDERLYCARVSPSKDTPISKVVDDLELVIPSDQHKMMRQDIGDLISRLSIDMSGVEERVVRAMGFSPAELMR